MKKALLVLVACLTHLYAQAQIRGGEQSLGGQVFLNFTENRAALNSEPQTERSFATGLSPTFAYFINENWSVGGLLSLTYRERRLNARNTQNEPMPFNVIDNSYGGGIFTQRYFKLRNYLYFRTRITGFYRYSLSRNPARGFGDYKIISRSVDANLTPAFSFFVKRDLAINLDWSALRYSYALDYNGNNDRHDFNFRLNLSAVQLGLEWFF